MSGTSGRVGAVGELDPGGAETEGMSEILLAHLRRWGEDLVDLRKGNRLVYFKHLRSGSFGFTQTAGEIIAGFGGRGANAGWGFHLPPDDHPDDPRADLPPPDELVVDPEMSKDVRQIERGLQGLARRAQEEYLESGLWVLYLGLGFLDWHSDGTDIRSPLYLLPVRLVNLGADKGWRLLRGEEGDPALNPSLAVKLETDHGIVLPALDDVSLDAYPYVIDSVRRAVDGTNWTVDDGAVLATFTFHKEVIYRDLQANAERVAGHPLVQLLVEGPMSEAAEGLAFDPEPEGTLDLNHPPENLACILDADATQRRCLIAARDGQSFVMDGPPGTGKSQTIANVIAQLLHDGRTVLFVSEKAAALDVVYNRLAAVGLGPFVLALHSNKTSRKAVAEELGAALGTEPRATSRFTVEDRIRIEQQRRELSDYAQAVNEVRAPLGRTLHDVIGRISALDGLPAVALTATDLRDLDPATLVQLLEQAERLGRTWGPVVGKADGFLWRDLAAPRGSAASVIDHRARVSQLRLTLTRLRDTARAIQADIGLPVDETSADLTPAGVEALQGVLGLVDTRSPVGAAWLVIDDTTDYDAWVEGLTVEAGRVDRQAAELAVMTPRWAHIDPGAAMRLQTRGGRVREIRPACGPLGHQTAAELTNLADALDAAARNLQGLRAPLQILSAALDIPGEVSVELARRLASLAALTAAPARPEATWFDERVVHQGREASRALQALLQDHRSFEAALGATFTPAALELDLEGLRYRFNSQHTGFKKLGGEYRADKAMLAGVTHSGEASAAVIGQLDRLVSWQRCLAEIRHTEAAAQPLLGLHRLPSAHRADYGRIDAALTVAEQALALARSDVDRDAVARVVGSQTPVDPELQRVADTVATVLAGVDGGPLRAWLATNRAGIEALAVDRAANWCGEVAAELRALADDAAPIEATLGRPIGINDAFELARRRAVHHEAWTALVGWAAPGRHITGAVGDKPVGGELRAATQWVRAVRRRHGGPLPVELANGLLTTTYSGSDLVGPLADADQARRHLLELFTGAYAEVLGAELGRSSGAAMDLLTTLDERADEVHDWWDHVEASAVMNRFGLDPAVSACRQHHVPGESVARVIELAVLRRWVEQMSAADPRLQRYRGVDRDEIRVEYQRLDRAMVLNAAAEVINACSDRRPRSAVGGAGLIRQQAELERKHLPVRTLLAQAGDAAQRLKPCFMMSPLSVSQFLPPDVNFDVVIFDEASQVKEADAIGCIYRGRQLIMAGDQKQLPPTNFFDRTVDGDDDEPDADDPLDFESVLDRCKAQGFVPLPLNWHYRSQHQDLITFSNYSFYDGRLHTFPGADFDAPDLGVGFYKVDGVYRRGGRGDNQIEARTVVDRVLFHRRHHPGATIGVIALSSKQQVAIETEIAERTRVEPELRDLDTDDRLTGFFVKNLENVQGDERDIILLSIGYGPDEAGKILMNFGPLNRDNGWRRLNVAVTRAKRRIEIVTSITRGDINSENESILHLARYLDFAERGHAALALDLEGSVGDAESPFEEEVIRSIRALGHDPVPQVGVAGYRIDVGIRHPTRPGNYLLGVECDGASYHSSKVARDRDRLRQQVLEGLGWRFHRIWSTAWFAERAGEEERLRAAIQSALGPPPMALSEVALSEVALSERADPVEPPAHDGGVPEIAVPPLVEMVTTDLKAPPLWVVPFVDLVAPPPGDLRFEFHDPNSRTAITEQLLAVVTQFGPLHHEAALRAVRTAWALERAGRRIRDQFDACLDRLCGRGSVVKDGDWLSVPGQPIVVRVPPDLMSPRRPVSEVPPAELELAIVELLREAGRAPFDEIRMAWARLFGWGRIGSDIDTAFGRSVQALATAGTISGPDPLQLVDQGHAA